MKNMALYNLPGLPLLLLAAFGLEPCSSGYALTHPSPSLPEDTMPSLRREPSLNMPGPTMASLRQEPSITMPEATVTSLRRDPSRNMPEANMASLRQELMEPSLNMPEATMASLRQEVEDNSRYKTLEANATLLKLLVDDKSGVSRSEVFDMLHSRDEDPDHVMDLPSFPDDMEAAKIDVTMSESSDPDSQTEFLQTPNKLVLKDSQRARSVRGGGGAGAAAGVMVATTCAIVTVAYAALLLYRRIYLKRNGLKHELLRNEDNIAETRIEL